MIDLLLAWLTWVANAFDRHRETVLAGCHWVFAASCGGSLFDQGIPPSERAALVAANMLFLHIMMFWVSANISGCLACALRIEQRDLVDRIRMSVMGLLAGIAWSSLFLDTVHAAAAWDPPVP